MGFKRNKMLRSRIAQYFEKNLKRKQKITLHFIAEGVEKESVPALNKHKTIKRKPDSRRRASIMTKNNKLKINEFSQKKVT